MVAFTYRMGGGIAGDVNRTHPASIEPDINDATNPTTFYGQACVYNQSADGTIRTVLASDTSLTSIAGITVRPYPIQQATDSLNYGQANIGSASISPVGPIDILKSGYMTVSVVGNPVKGNPVYVWVAASTGNHVQGGFEAASSSGNTIELTTQGQTYFNSQADASGNCEIAFNM